MERREAGLKFRIVRGSGQEHADAPHALGLLRARGKRPRRRRTTQNAEKFPSPHVRPQAQETSIVSAQTSTLIGAETRLRYCNIRCWPMSEMGPGCVKTPTLAERVETF